MSVRRLVKARLLVIAIGVAFFATACEGSAAPAGTASGGGPAGSAVVPGPPKGPSVHVTLVPSGPASPGTLAASAAVIRRRAGLLGLQRVQVAVSGQDVVVTGLESDRAQLELIATTDGALAFRPVLLMAQFAGTPAGAKPYGEPGTVNAATHGLFGKLACKPGSGTVDDSWKATVGYAAANGQYDDPASQVVSCDAKGGKYALGPAVFTGQDITSVSTSMLQASAEWAVLVTLDGKAALAFRALTANQYNDHYVPYSSSGGTDLNDEALAETAIVLDGDVQSAPVATGPVTGSQLQIVGGSPGYTQDAARNLAALLGGGQLPVILRIASIQPLTQ